MAGAPARRHDDKTARRGRADLPPRWHHLRGLWRQGRGRRRHRAPDTVRPDPAHHSGPRVGRARKRPGAARDRTEPLHQGCLPRPGDPQGGSDPVRAGSQERAIPLPDGRRACARRCLFAYRRRRYCACAQCRGQRRVLRARGQPARPQRRQLHAGKPQDDDAAVSRTVQRASRGASRALPRPAAGNPARFEPGHHGRTDRRGADPRHAQQRLLRTCIPGPADGRGTGRGAGPVRQGQVRLHAHHARTETRRRDLSPRRRRLPRPGRVSRRFDARMCRADRCVPRRPCDAVQCRRDRRGRRQVDLSVRAQDGRVLPGREADPEQRAHLHLPQQGRPGLYAGQPEGPGGEGGARGRWLRHAGGPCRHQG